MEYKKIRGTLTDEFRRGNHSIYELGEYIRVKDCFGEVTEPFKYVVISDADTHIERLVFAARLLGEMTEEDVLNNVPRALNINYRQIEGTMTMMIHGGDYSTIEPPEKYLQRLIENNTHK